jgi:uncharacterized protein YraI
MKKIIALCFIFVLLVTACKPILKDQGSSVDINAAIQQTLDVQNQAATLVAQTQAAAAVVAPVQPVVAPIEIPTIAVPPTTAPVASVKATAIKNANCRSGPASNFDYLSVLNQGASADVIGKNTDFGKWWKVKLVDGTECWVVDDAVTLAGDTGSLALLESPKTPTPVPPPSWAGNWTMKLSGSFENTGADVNVFNTSITQSGNSISFSYNMWSQEFSCFGTVSADGMTVNGTMVSSDGGGRTWNFYFVRVPSNLNQFRGKYWWGGDASMDGMSCGAKNGAALPDPCRP